MSSHAPRIGYVPYDERLTHPGDIRRFVAYARARNLPIEIARPDQRYDLVVLSELADVTVWSNYSGGKVVYDLIDSYLAVPRSDIKQMLRGLVWYANGRQRHLSLDFKGALEDMCRRADAVVCTTAEQQRDIAPLCRNVHVILDIHDDVAQSRKRDYAAQRPFKLVWEGLPSNVPQLAAIGDVLREVTRKRPLVLNIVTDADRPAGVPLLPRIKTIDVAKTIFDAVVLHRWEQATVSGVITACDLAVIPIFTDHVFTRGKPGNKLALLWRMAMPVVTSATPAYRAMQGAAGLGRFACDDLAQWRTALETLIDDEAARRDAGERGYAYVQDNLRKEHLLSLWDGVLASVGMRV